MRNLIEQLLKSQRYLFVAVFGGLIIVLTSWYFLVQKGLSKEHKRSSNAMIVLEKDVEASLEEWNLKSLTLRLSGTI